LMRARILLLIISGSAGSEPLYSISKNVPKLFTCSMTTS
jgi:hypothetical protein